MAKEPFERRHEKEEEFAWGCTICNHLYYPSRRSEHLRSPEHLAAREEEFAWGCTTCNHLYYLSRKSEHLRSSEHLAAVAAERKKREP